MIELKNLTKIYGKGNRGVMALRNLTLSVKKGEFVCIMGTSGCGKSTLLNIISLLDSQTHGEYLLENRDVSEFSADQKAKLRNKFFGFVFQSFNLINEMTALQNVCLPLKYSTIPKKQRKEIGLNTMKALDILYLQNKIPDEMSGGEQQRVAIARALVNKPDIILADEPTGNLDSRTGYDIVGVLGKLCKDEGKTIVMVSHDAKIASFANRIIQMSDGRIIDDTDLSTENSEPLQLNFFYKGEDTYEADI